ncbi:MAG: gliding motility protein RemB, partial [Flavobacteriaceae bacterium]
MIQIKRVLFLVLALLPIISFSQDEKFPVFESCKEVKISNEEMCFYNEVKKLFFEEFKTPEAVKKDEYNETVGATFIVTSSGKFKLIFISSPYKEIKEEVDRVFENFPNIKPATYNNHNIEMQFVLPISFPISANTYNNVISKKESKKDINLVVEQQQIADSTFLEHNSQLNIPFVHQKYVDYDYALNKANGTHTTIKPYIYSDVNKYFDFEAEKKQFLKPEKKSWFGRKLWNEHLLQVKHKDYWLTADFLVDVQLGKDNSDNVSYTFNNTRLFTINGGLGKNLSFSSTIYESQGRFANY